MTKNFDTAVLRTFVAVTQTGSLARAAALTGRSQPAVSQQLMRLEDIVQLKLFDRGPRGAKLTPDGEAFLSYALRILALTDEAIERFQPQQFKGRIALGVIEDFAFGFLTEALIDFAKMHPDLEMEVIVANSRSMQEDLISGRIDMALGDPFYLNHHTLWRTQMELRWYASEKFDAAQSPLPLVMFSEPCRWREPLLAGLNAASLRWRIVYESSSLQAIHAAAAAGLGVACCLERAVPPGARILRELAGLPKAPVVEVAMEVTDAKKNDPTILYLSDLIQRLLTQ
ncbi:MAG: LysR family transcriptional regulator [Kordiimonadaceae bacterium]|nr:LysR family transcriptional regulator [Kordiimonadaceae bacterium]